MQHFNVAIEKKNCYWKNFDPISRCLFKCVHIEVYGTSIMETLSHSDITRCNITSLLQLKMVVMIGWRRRRNAFILQVIKEKTKYSNHSSQQQRKRLKRKDSAYALYFCTAMETHGATLKTLVGKVWGGCIIFL